MNKEQEATRRKKNREKQKRFLERHPEARAKRNQYATYWRIRKKKELIGYKGGKCEMCGYDKDVLGAYDFHHKDPSKKEFGISKWQHLNIEKLKREVDKCQLVCRNCHAEIHDNKELREEAEILVRRERRLIKLTCRCGKKFFTKEVRSRKKYCSQECKNLYSRKVDRPSRDVLEEMIGCMTWTAMGEQFGVSDNAVRKWAKNYKLT